MPGSKIDADDMSRLRAIAYLEYRGKHDYAKQIANVVTEKPARDVADVLIKTAKAGSESIATLVREVRNSVKMGTRPVKSTGKFYIERRDDGYYSVKKGGARASAVEKTQRDAIQRARQIDPSAVIHVERVRDTDIGSRDKWRKL